MVLGIKTVDTGLTEKRHGRIFQGDENVVYLYRSVHYVAFVKIHLCFLLYINYTSIKE